MPQLHQRLGPWPERHGFSIGGKGPCYVLCVVRGSAADKQKLKRGDQIIELNNQRVDLMDASALEKHAKYMATSKPVLQVINRVQRIQMFATRLHGFGFQLQYSRRHGFIVDSVNPKGPAYKAGIRKGDLVLEMNGEPIFEKVNALEYTSKVLSAVRGRITLAILPQEDRGRLMDFTSRTENRVRDDKYLYGKINKLFDDNYEKKMAVIGVLDMYFEDRNIEKLARALVAILQTSIYRRIIPYISLYIPGRDRKRFDELVQRSIGKTYAQDRLDSQAEDITALQDHHHYHHHMGHSPVRTTTSSLLYLRAVTMVKKDRSGLGVLLRGENPVVVHDVIPGSVAESAGVLVGDCILTINSLSVQHADHHEVQNILKRSDRIVQLDVIQKIHMGEEQQLKTNAASSTGTCSVPSFNFDILSTVTSHNHSEQESERLNLGASASELRLQALPDARIDMSRGDYSNSTLTSDQSSSSSPWGMREPNIKSKENSFIRQVNYLLDKKERHRFKQLLLNYSRTKDIVSFVESVNEVLDTTSKRELWEFIIPRLSRKSHKDYVTEHVNFIQQDYVDSRADTREYHFQTNANHQNPNDSFLHTNGASQTTLSSFKSQLDFLLTSKERRNVTSALKTYKNGRNIEKLVEDLNVILDTDSKRSLWIHILNLLISSSHQKYVRRTIDLPNGFVREASKSWNTPSKRKNSPRRVNRILKQSEDEFFVVGQNVDGATSTTDDEERVNVNMTNYQPRGSYAYRKDYQYPGADHFSVNPLYGHRPSLSNPEAIVVSGVNGTTITASETIAMPHFTSNSYKRGKPNAAHVALNNSHTTGSSNTLSSHYTNGSNGIEKSLSTSKLNNLSRSPRQYEKVFEQTINNNHEEPNKQLKTESTGVSVTASLQEDTPADPQTSQGSDVSFRKQVTQALQAMDEAVSGTKLDETYESEADEPNAPVSVIPLAPPPPPPLPPMIPGPPPLPGVSAPLQVKRLNWEVHQPDDISETVWGQRHSGSDYLDVTDMLEYLELPQQFSTVKKKPASFAKVIKTSKLKVLSDKKAFNTSIILASLNSSVRKRLKEALLQMNEEILSPHLLTQLLQYAPDGKEMEAYAACTGRVSELSDVDKFVYEMTRVPGYESRLKAMYFRATFHEKCEVVENQLHIVKMASHEVQHSKRFAKILDLVLAMGNQLHKASNSTTAAAFKVAFLAQLDSTKTQDKKKSFLDVLAQLAHEKCPNVLETYADLSSVGEAERVSFQDIAKEISELQEFLSGISKTMSDLAAEAKHYTDEDKFQDVMEHFVSEAEDKVQNLQKSLAEASEAYNAMVKYLGEKPENKEIFSDIHTFLHKFEHAHRQLLMKIENGVLSPCSPTSETYQCMSRYT